MNRKSFEQHVMNSAGNVNAAIHLNNSPEEIWKWVCILAQALDSVPDHVVKDSPAYTYADEVYHAAEKYVSRIEEGEKA